MITYRMLGWLSLWSAVAVGWVLVFAPPWWLHVAVCAAIGALVPWAVRNEVLSYGWAWLRRHRDLHAPVVVDEDGVIRVPLLLPGERIEVIHHTDGDRQVYVLRRNGSVRAQWPTRH